VAVAPLVAWPTNRHSLEWLLYASSRPSGPSSLLLPYVWNGPDLTGKPPSPRMTRIWAIGYTKGAGPLFLVLPSLLICNSTLCGECFDTQEMTQ
jgi:hypothetical protein